MVVIDLKKELARNCLAIKFDKYKTYILSTIKKMYQYL